MACETKKFFMCKHCGNFVGTIHFSGVKMVCCGEPMVEIVANTTDASQEKHVPVVKVEGNIVTVTIGSALHPMTPEHHISWIILETTDGVQRKCLPVDGQPIATFALAAGEKPVQAFEYCNLHGLWKAVI